jgi:FSR family fosmidomycin resistance protein-like MFS transporter
MTREEKRIMGLTFSSHGLVHLFEGVLPPLIPLLLGVFRTDYFHLGLIVTIFSYAFGLGALPSGFLADRVGPGRLISIYLFGSGLLSVCVLPLESLITYGLIMGLMGLFCSTYHPASNTLISHGIREKGKAFGIHGISGSLGVAVIPILSAWIGSVMGWKAPHIIFGLFAVGLGFYSLTVPGRTVEPNSPVLAEARGGGLRSVSYLNLVIFFLSAISLGLTYKGIMTFLPSYMGQNVHLSFLRLNTVTLGGTVATVALLSGALGQYLAGRLVDRYNPEQLYLGAIVIGAFFVFVMANSASVLLVISAVFYAFFYFSTQPIQIYLLSRYVPPHRHGLGYGTYFLLTFGVGSTAAAGSGYLADQFGLKWVFYAMGLCFILSSCFALLLLFTAYTQRKTSV